MRVQSPKPARNSMGGWLHPLDAKQVVLPPPRPAAPKINAPFLFERYQEHTQDSQISELGNLLGIQTASLAAMPCAWAQPYDAWAFPMRNEKRDIVGIRLRNRSGRKWAVPGSRQGVFVPNIELEDIVYVCEGPTDTAAALSIGLCAVGRPSCTGGVPELKGLFTWSRVRRVVVISDNDSPGLNGAQSLCDQLRLPVALLLLPAKDMRAFVNAGGDLLVIASILRGVRWRMPE